MTEAAFDPQCLFPFIHRLHQVFVTDIFGQYLEVHLRRLAGEGTDGGHTNDEQGEKGEGDGDLFEREHTGVFIPECKERRLDNPKIVTVF